MDLHTGGLRHDAHLFVLGQIRHDDVEHEAIELSLRQRIGSFELDGILRGQDEERTLQRIGPSGRRHVILLHRFEQGRLRLRRRAVDLVGQDDLREDRPLHEAERPVSSLLVQDFRAGDVGGHQIRRELNPLERQVQNACDRLDEQRLRQTGHARDQAVAAGEERHQHLVDDRVLADDHLADLREDALPSLSHALGDGSDARGPAGSGRLSGRVSRSVRLQPGRTEWIHQWVRE